MWRTKIEIKKRLHYESYFGDVTVLFVRDKGKLILNGNQGCQMVDSQTQKSQLVSILEGLRVENVRIFYGHLAYFMAI
jgi:hypothetical protein